MSKYKERKAESLKNIRRMIGHDRNNEGAQTLEKLLLIDNRPGNWMVTLFEARGTVGMFQCRTPSAVAQAVQIMQQERAAAGLPTTWAKRMQILSDPGGRNRRFGPAVEVEPT